jgi:hypothetical protein
LIFETAVIDLVNKNNYFPNIAMDHFRS